MRKEIENQINLHKGYNCQIVEILFKEMKTRGQQQCKTH